MEATARIHRHAAVWGRLISRPRRTVAARSLAAGVTALALVGLFVLSALPTARAQGPVGDAMQTIVAATVAAQQTRDAQEAQAASQRATASALDIQMRQAAATVTRAAMLQQAADAQATRTAESARATQTAAARATAQVLQVQATATEQARLSAATTAQILAAQADATRAANATATSVAIHADATRTALALSTQNAQRDAQFQTLFSGSAIVIAWLLATMLFLRLVKQLRSSKPRPVVVVVSDPAPFGSAQDVLSDGAAEIKTVNADASRVPPSTVLRMYPSTCAQEAGDEPRSFVVSDPQAARAIAQLIEQDMAAPDTAAEDTHDPTKSNSATSNHGA